MEQENGVFHQQNPNKHFSSLHLSFYYLRLVVVKNPRFIKALPSRGPTYPFLIYLHIITCQVLENQFNLLIET